MEVGTFASPVAVARALPIGCRQQSTPIRIGHGVHLYLAGAHSAHYELQFARKNRELKHVKSRRTAICVQLAESEKQMVEEQEAMASSSKCVLVVGATGGVGTTLFAIEIFFLPPNQVSAGFSDSYKFCPIEDVSYSLWCELVHRIVKLRVIRTVWVKLTFHNLRRAF